MIELVGYKGDRPDLLKCYTIPEISYIIHIWSQCLQPPAPCYSVYNKKAPCIHGAIKK